MKLLVTTSQSLLHVDTDSGESTPLDRGRGLYYGIAHADDKLYVASRKRAVSSETEAATERGQILIFDRSLKACGVLHSPFPLRDLHEIAWHEGKLYASCSHDNMVAIYDGANWEQWFPLGGSLVGDVGPGDINHFNSFFFEDGLIWVLAHNRGNSELLGFTLATKELQQRLFLGSSAHNIWREDGQIFTCSSMEGKVIGDRGFVLETGNFPRGFARAENFRCVGVSAMAERKARDFTTGKLAIFDGDWKPVKEIVLMNEGLVLDVQLLPAGFAFDIRADEEDIGLAKDSFYRAYEDRNRGSRNLIKSRLLAYRAFFEPWLDHELAPKALDLGCGRGEWLELLRDAGFSSRGVDLDLGMLSGLRKLGLDARHANALQALRETDAESLAIVSAFHLVEHIPFEDVRTIVREAMRVLKPGGLLILETPNPENLVVGSSLFYQDPTHLHPLPPELLRFTVEYEGFERHVITRLQEAPSLHGENDIGLLSVLEGVSPDYAVVGQKPAAPDFLHKFDAAFDAGYGITLHALAHRYESQERRRTANLTARTDARTDQHFRDLRYNLDKAEERIAQLELHNLVLEEQKKEFDYKVQQLNEQLALVFNSRNWKFGAPLRWADLQISLIRQMGLMTRLRMLRNKIAKAILRKAAGMIDRRPGIRKSFVHVIKVTGLYGKMRTLHGKLGDASTQMVMPVRSLDPNVSDMSERCASMYYDIKNSAARDRGHS